MAQNLIVNSSFECDEQAAPYAGAGFERFLVNETIYGGGTPLGGAPDQWTIYGSGAMAAYVSTVAKHGLYSLSLYNTQQLTVGQTGGLAQTMLKCTGRPYVFSFYVRGSLGANANVYVNITWFNAAGAQQGTGSEGQAQFTQAQINAAMDASGWARLSFVPANTGGSEDHMSVQIGCIAVGGTVAAGTFSMGFDALQLETNGSGAPAVYFPALWKPQTSYDFNNQVNSVAGIAQDTVVPYGAGEITFAGVKFNGEAHPYSGETWKLLVEASRGLYDFPPLKSSGDFEDPANHGGRLGVDRFGMRVIELDVALMADTEAELFNRARQIHQQLLPLVSATEQRLQFVRSQADGPTSGPDARKWTWARLRRFTGFDTSHDAIQLGVLRGSLQFVCPDPAYYSITKQIYTVNVPSGNTSYSTNSYYASRGNFRDFPIIVVNGPVTNPRIQMVPSNPVDPGEGASRTIYYAAAIAAGHYVVFDTYKRTVLIDGVTDGRANLDPSNQWWYSPSEYLPQGSQNIRGANVNFLSSVNASGYTVQIFHWDGWL